MTHTEQITRRMEQLIIEKTLLQQKVEQLEQQLKAENKVNIFKNMNINLVKLN